MNGCVICGKLAEYGYLCRGHFTGLGSMLRDIEDQAAMLSPVPSMAVRTGSGGGSLPSERAPARLDVIVHTDPRSRPAGERPPGPACVSCWHGSCTDIRAWVDAYDAHANEALSILDVLSSWAQAVREERNLTVPVRVTISGERDVLTRHLDWIAGQPWIDEIFKDVRVLLGQLKATNGIRAERPLTRCVVPLIHGLCGGNVWELEAVQVVETVRGRWTMSAPGGPAECDNCGAKWETDADKARLKLMIEQEHDERTRPRTEDGRQMLTATEMQMRLRLKPGAFRQRVHRLGIASFDGYYDPDLFDDKATA